MRMGTGRPNPPGKKKTQDILISEAGKNRERLKSGSINLTNLSQAEYDRIRNLSRLEQREELNRAKFLGSSPKGAIKQTPYGEWKNTPPSERSWVGNLVAPNYPASKRTPTWYGEGGWFSDRYSTPLILDRMARDIASGRVTPSETLSAIWKNRGIQKYTRLNPVQIPGLKTPLYVGYTGPLSNPLARILKRAVQSTELEWNPPGPRFVPNGDPNDMSQTPTSLKNSRPVPPEPDSSESGKSKNKTEGVKPPSVRAISSNKNLKF
jgi:hypothetical protein